MANKYSKYKNCKHVIACYNIIVAGEGLFTVCKHWNGNSSSMADCGGAKRCIAGIKGRRD